LKWFDVKSARIAVFNLFLSGTIFCLQVCMFTGYVSREIKQTINSYRSLNSV